MKSTYFFLLMLIFFLSPPFAASSRADGGSGREGHGGTVLVCDTTTERPEFRSRALLADFAEVLLLPGLNSRMQILESSFSVDIQIEQAVQRLRLVSEKLAAELRAEITRIRKTAFEVRGFYWPVTSDVGPFPMPLPEEACQLRNTVNYFSDQDIQVNPTLVSRLSLTHQAGLWVHEGIYFLIRKYTHAKDAYAARKITAYLFSNLPAPSPLLRELIDRHLSPLSHAPGVVEAFPVSSLGLPLLVVVPFGPRCYMNDRPQLTYIVDGKFIDDVKEEGTKNDPYSRRFSYRFKLGTVRPDMSISIRLLSLRRPSPFSGVPEQEEHLNYCRPYALAGRYLIFFQIRFESLNASLEVQIHPGLDAYDEYMRGRLTL